MPKRRDRQIAAELLEPLPVRVVVVTQDAVAVRDAGKYRGDVVRRHQGGDGKEKCRANVRAMRLESWPSRGNRQQSRGVPW